LHIPGRQDAVARSQTPLIEMRGIVKRFYGKPANDRVDLALRPGEVLALLGENGAGKSTLVKILYGLYVPDAGEILVRGTPVRIGSPRDAMALGIGMVHQHFTLVPELTVAENIALCAPPARRGVLLDLAGVEGRIRDLSTRYGIRVDPARRVRELSVGERQRVEILKVLSGGAGILVLDEPTAVLTPREAAELFGMIESLKRGGAGIVLISHKLEEVMAVSDRVTVLRGGRVVLDTATRRTDVRALAAAMMGRETPPPSRRTARQPGRPVLEVRGLRARGDSGHEALRGVSFTVREGEIVGLAGVSGNGQCELAEVLSGLRPASAGGFLLRGVGMHGATPRRLAMCGVGRIPEDRMETGAILDLPLKHNLILERYHLAPFSRRYRQVTGEIDACAERLVAEYRIAAHSIGIELRTLSGGNIQKAILARALDPHPSLIIAAQPARGLDVGAAAFVHRRLLDERDRGAAVLLVSEDLDEILALADTIGVIHRGEILRICPTGETDRGCIGMLMAGVREGRR
jgi:simple sugar transport system ATP-binding protein